MLGDKCCGCGACSAACPRTCIHMEEDARGFLHPIIDENSCVGCLACDRVCPALNSHNRDDVLSVSWAKANEKSLLLASSSGGIFGLLAKRVLDAKGVVAGASFDNCLRLRHVLVEREQDLDPLRSSKYVQSVVDKDVYHSLRNAVLEGRKVLFSGTACQVAALRAYLGDLSKEENLLLVDVVCHGVPSPKLWRLWVSYLERKTGSKLASVNFRDKSTGWSSYSVSYRFENGIVRRSLAADDWYIKAFSRNASLRPSCFSCPTKGACGSDLTLGDFWGIQEKRPFLGWSEGMSAVIVRTPRGVDALSEISSSISFDEMSFDQVCASNGSVINPSEKGRCFEEIMAELENDVPFETIEERCPFLRSPVQRLISTLGVLRSQINRIICR